MSQAPTWPGGLPGHVLSGQFGSGEPGISQPFPPRGKRPGVPAAEPPDVHRDTDLGARLRRAGPAGSATLRAAPPPPLSAPTRTRTAGPVRPRPRRARGMLPADRPDPVTSHPNHRGQLLDRGTRGPVAVQQLGERSPVPEPASVAHRVHQPDPVPVLQLPRPRPPLLHRRGGHQYTHTANVGTGQEAGNSLRNCQRHQSSSVHVRTIRSWP